MDKSKSYYCYSKPQKDFLHNKGIEYFDEGIHLKTQKQYWIFDRNDKLHIALSQWQENKRKAIDLIRQLNQ